MKNLDDKIKSYSGQENIETLAIYLILSINEAQKVYNEVFINFLI
ncbi:hypothetical protein [Clostridium tagluense]|nr:hypothetical protein [Clostridium tagluense]